jgi:hypothetical protein
MIETNRTEGCMYLQKLVFLKLSRRIQLKEASKILHYFNKLATNKVPM